jgi:hypothetical protein
MGQLEQRGDCGVQVRCPKATKRLHICGEMPNRMD